MKGNNSHLPHKIEPSRSNRAKCRTCGETLVKGELRLGEAPFPGSTQEYLRWNHLECAADKRPDVFLAAIDLYDGDIPNRATLVSIASGERAPATRHESEAA